MIDAVDIFNDKSILVTSGTGSFGRRFVQTVLSRHRPKRLVVFSRDELKQERVVSALAKALC